MEQSAMLHGHLRGDSLTVIPSQRMDIIDSAFLKPKIGTPNYFEWVAKSTQCQVRRFLCYP